MRELQAKHEDRLKMNMDKACNMNFVATPEQVASMTMKGQTKPIFSVSLTGVIAEEEQHVWNLHWTSKADTLLDDFVDQVAD